MTRSSAGPRVVDLIASEFGAIVRRFSTYEFGRDAEEQVLLLRQGVNRSPVPVRKVGRVADAMTPVLFAALSMRASSNTPARAAVRKFSTARDERNRQSGAFPASRFY
jgi:hypothetical protein